MLRHGGGKIYLNVRPKTNLKESTQFAGRVSHDECDCRGDLCGQGERFKKARFKLF
jgi:hypothetical protein